VADRPIPELGENQRRSIAIHDGHTGVLCKGSERAFSFPSLTLVSRLGRFYVLQLVDKFSDATGDVLVEPAGGD
jgi:hypothetical protein